MQHIRSRILHCLLVRCVASSVFRRKFRGSCFITCQLQELPHSQAPEIASATAAFNISSIQFLLAQQPQQCRVVAQGCRSVARSVQIPLRQLISFCSVVVGKVSTFFLFFLSRAHRLQSFQCNRLPKPRYPTCFRLPVCAYRGY